MTLFEDNLRALAARSPSTAAVVADAGSDGPYVVTVASSGDPIVECGGRALDSRRDPAGAARRDAAPVTAAHAVVVAGLGTGYFADALRERGVRVAVIVEANAMGLAAAMRARDLRPLLSEVPVALVATLKDRIELATWRARADTVVPHAPSVAAHPDLAALVAAWPSVRVAKRKPRVLVIGPIYGGTLETSRHAVAAFTACGADARLFDGSVFASAHEAFGSLPGPSATRNSLQGGFAALLGTAIVAAATEWKPDLVFALAQAPLGDTSIQHLRALGITTAFWFVENSRVLTYWRGVAEHYDWFYAIQPGRFLEQLSEHGAVHPAYLPQACDPVQHRPIELTPADREHFGSAVSFAGAPYLNRRRVFQSLTDFGLKLWGPSWDDPVLAPYVGGTGGRFTLDEMVKIFSASTINVNLHSANHIDRLDPDPDYVNPRTFELAACEAFQLVDRRDPLRDLFRPDEVATFDSVPELRTLTARYLAHDDERREMAARARRRALGEHTFAHRIARVMRDTLAPELVAAATVGVTNESLDEAIGRLERAGTTLTDAEMELRVVREVNQAWLGR